MSKKLSVVVISTTPFAEDGSIDEAAFRQQMRRLGSAGCAVYVAGSGTSEAYTYTPEERDRVMEIAVEELKGKVQVRAMGCEPRTPDEMISFIRAAERAKVDAAQIFSLEIGHAIKPTTIELDLYYSSIIETTSMPIYLSSHYASGYVLPIDLVETLVNRFPNIVGIAYGGTETTYLAELIARVGDRIEVHCAGPANAVNSLALGGNGFMGGEGNFSPEMVIAVIKAWEAKDMDAVRKSFGTLMAFARIYVRYGGHAARGLKPLMNAFGLPGGHMRPPRVAISPEEVAEMVRLVKALDIPGIPPLAEAG
jgi:4-hydroxy-tetrahydrodipicolinate synthase